MINTVSKTVTVAKKFPNLLTLRGWLRDNCKREEDCEKVLINGGYILKYSKTIQVKAETQTA